MDSLDTMVRGSNGLYKIESPDNTMKEERYNDLLFIRHILKNFRSLQENSYLNPNEDMQCILIDIKKAFSCIDMTEKDYSILRDFMDGYSLQEIGEMNGFNRSYSSKRIANICEKIKMVLTNES